MTRTRLLAVLVLMLGLTIDGDVFARGFGGARGGGFRGAGMSRGGFSGGGMRGGVRAGSVSGFRAEGPRGGSMSGFNANRYGGARGNGIAGVRGGSVSGFRAEGPRGGSVGGFSANRFGAAGARGGGIGGREGAVGAANLNRAPSRSGLNNFLGLPSDGGLHAVSRSAGTLPSVEAGRGVVEGPRGGVAAGGARRGPLGGTAAHGVAVGPRGNVVGGRAARGPLGNGVAQGFATGPRGLRSFSAASLHTGATAVRRNFHGRNLYSQGWYARYPGAWTATGWGAGYAWRAATWASLGGWFNSSYGEPVYYDYGNNVTYQDNSVYVNGQEAGTDQEYYSQSQVLVNRAAQPDTPSDEQWMPLGVFAMTKQGNDSATMDFQLAVNKAGIIRGNYTNPVSNKVEPIHGSVDKKTQRAAWTIKGNDETVIETGIYNLTKDEASALVHFGPERSEQWILVRISKNEQSAAPGP